MKYTSLINKRMRLFSKWLLPYVLILLLPLLLNGWAFSTMKNVVRKQTISTNNLILNQIKQNSDKAFSQVRQAFVQLYFSDIFSSGNSLTTYDIHLISDQLKNISSSYPLISQIILYHDDSDFVITSNIAVDSKSYYEAYNTLSAPSYKDFINLITQNYSGNIASYASKDTENNNQSVLVYHKTMNNINKQQSSYNVFIIIENSRFFENISDINLLQSGLFVMLDNKQSSVINSRGNKELSNYLSDITEGKEPDESVVLSSTQSEIFDLSYHMILPETTFWREEYRIQSMFVLSIILCILLGIIIISSSIKTNYNPVKNLAEMLKFKGSQMQAADDMNSIYTGISDIIEQYSTIMSTQNVGLRTAFLQRFIRGREEGDILEEHFETYDISFVSDKFAVVLIYIEDFSEFFVGAENLSNDEKFRFAHLTITNIFEELSSEFCRPYYVDLDFTIGYIINFNPDIDYRVADTLKQVQEFVKQHFAIHTSIAVSDMLTSVESVPMAYNQALETLDYREVMGTETVIEYSEIVNINNQSFYYPLDMEQHLINCIKAGECQNAQNILDTIYKNNFEKQTMTLNTARCLLFNLVSTMIKAINSKSNSLDEAFVGGDDYIARLLECKSIQEHKALLSEMLNQFCEYNSETVSDSNLIDKITDYIKNNYQDINLNVAAVAKHFAFHPTYISNMFKKQTGQGLFDVIKEVRVEAAKKLLKEDNDTIDGVAGKCGFTNSKTFTRTFKSVTGLTPGKYKELG